MSCASGPIATQPEGPAFIITTKNLEDQVSVQNENGIAWIDVQSPGGIGSASFQLVAGTMPENMTVQFHLKGLEQLRLTSAEDEISASVSSTQAASVDTQTLLSSGTEAPLSPGDPLWMDIKIVSETGKKIPLEEGYFEVTVPQEFIRNAGTTFEIEWIDFYR